MKLLPLLLLLGAQADPLAAARRDLGPGFACESIDKGLILASDADESRRAALRTLLGKLVAALREHAFVPVPQNTLTVLSFKDTEGVKAYTAKRYERPIELPAFYDVVQRRLLVHDEIAASFAPNVVLIFLLGEHLGTPTPLPWAAAALGILVEEPAEEVSIFDPRAALLRGALKRGTLPPLASLLKMDLTAFSQPGRRGLHNTLSMRLAHYLKSRGLLVKFFEEFRKSHRRDPTGRSALEVALGRKIDEVQKDFEAYVSGLPWVNEQRFRDHARKAFGADVHFMIDEERFLAVAADTDRAAAEQAVAAIKRLHEPLVKHLELTPTGLPLLIRLFRNETAFQAFAKIESPERDALAGYYIPISRSIAVNFSAGAGTLTHEYAHSIFEDDLGILPPWANEGLASLYQRFRIEDGVPIPERGDTVRDVRAAIDRLPRLADLVLFKGKAFWGEPGTRHLHYELARAVFLYLHEKGKLAEFLRHIRTVKAAVPLAPPVTLCRQALEKATSMKPDALEQDFRRWLAAS